MASKEPTCEANPYLREPAATSLLNPGHNEAASSSSDDGSSKTSCNDGKTERGSTD